MFLQYYLIKYESTTTSTILTNRTLYEEANKHRKKEAKLEYTTMVNILLDAKKSKINNNSHKIAISKTEKLIDEKTPQ